MKLIDDILFIKLVEFAKYNFVKSSKNKFVNMILDGKKGVVQ